MTKLSIDSDLRPEYDFTGGVRGKHYKARLNGYILKIHKSDGTIQVIKVEVRDSIKHPEDDNLYV
jgi:hypothetical protein